MLLLVLLVNGNLSSPSPGPLEGPDLTNTVRQSCVSVHVIHNGN